jgi:hypothetical protein
MLALMIIIFVCGVIVFDLHSRTRLIREKLRAFRERVPDFKYRASFTAICLTGVFDGFSVTITVTPGGNRSRPKIIVACHKVTPFRLTILRNVSQADFFTRLAHSPILCSIAKTNDNNFDTRFSVYSHNNTDVAGYFYNTGRKAAVISMFDLGFNLISFKGSKIYAQKFDYDVENDLEPGVLTGILDKLCVLARGF